VATTVVNIKYAPDGYDVYVGRPGKGAAGPFGNPYRAQQHGKGALELFREHFLKRVAEDAKFREAVLALKGKRLGCFCRPKSGFRGRLGCHGQIIAAWCDGVRPEDVP
jgi:hypothetical protein